MNILVTGGAGFIGSNVIGRLLEYDHNVVCLDNFDDYYSPALKQNNISIFLVNKQFHLIKGDLRDTIVLDSAFSKVAIDVVIHLAARAGVRTSLEQPELYYDTNVIGTLRLLEAMRRHKVSRMIFASSSSVYGNNKKVPFSETDPVDNPISPYAASKKGAELLCHTYHHLYGFDIYCLRFFTVYGPRQRPDMAITHFITNILNGRPITLFGDGKSQRDYTYIDDILDGIMKSVNHLKGYEIINLGESKTIPLISLIALIEQVSGKKANICFQPMQSGDVAVTYADITKARNILGYNPVYHIKDGLVRQIEWEKATKILIKF